jgi:holo-[acyl-carrier protein] synthase
MRRQPPGDAAAATSACPGEGPECHGLSRLLPVRLSPLRPLEDAPSGAGPRARAQIGVDLIAVSKVQRVFEGKPALLTRVFTTEELAYATRQRRPFVHLAARFAAKEAVFKGVGTGLAAGMTWRDVATVHRTRGAPALRLSGETARLLRARGFRRYALSLSHSEDYALAAVLFTP